MKKNDKVFAIAIEALHAAIAELDKIASLLKVSLHHHPNPSRLADRLIELEPAA